ncbi:D-aminoacyl-tRNA deacylase [Cucumispora dikerogammari]|nr:D-aminoacyl-tRNA deacylase [Cucumispora dikerogammari]
MKCITQILKSGTIITNNTTIQMPSETLIVFMGISKTDTQETVEKAIRYFSKTDFEGFFFMSNYTINGRLKATKFSYHLNMDKEMAEKFFIDFVDQIRLAMPQRRVGRGQFGGDTDVKGHFVGSFIIDF